MYSRPIDIHNIDEGVDRKQLTQLKQRFLQLNQLRHERTSAALPERQQQFLHLLPLLFQIGFGLSPFQSGLLLLASALGNLGMKAGTSWILDRFGFRRVALVDVTIVGFCTIACGWLTASTPLTITLLIVFVYGLTRSMQFTTLATLAYADIPSHQTSAASTLWSAAQQMTIGMGIAFGALALRLAALVRGDAAGIHYVLDDFRWAFVAAGVLALLTLPGYVRLASDAGDRLRASAARG